MAWAHHPHHWPFVWVNHHTQVVLPPHKGPEMQIFCFFFVNLINCWTNSRMPFSYAMTLVWRHCHMFLLQDGRPPGRPPSGRQMTPEVRAPSDVVRERLGRTMERVSCFHNGLRNCGCQCGCLFTWFCYQLIAKPGNKTAAVSWPDLYVSETDGVRCGNIRVAQAYELDNSSTKTCQPLGNMKYIW